MANSGNGTDALTEPSEKGALKAQLAWLRVLFIGKGLIFMGPLVGAMSNLVMRGDAGDGRRTVLFLPTDSVRRL
jgi:hypothetical protein